METPGAGVIRVARKICAGWGLTTAEAEQLVARDPMRAAAVIRIAELLGALYSDPLPQLWMTIENRNAALGGAPVRPVDYVLRSEGGIWDVVALLESFGQGK